MLGRTSSAPSPFGSEIILDRINPCIANEIKVWLPHTIAKRNRQVRYLIMIQNRHAYHDTYKTVSIEIVGTIVCNMIETFSNFLPNLDIMVSSTHRKAGCIFHYTSESSVRYFFMKKVVKWCYLNNTYKKMELSYYNSIFQ